MVLGPAAIARELMRLGSHPYVARIAPVEQQEPPAEPGPGMREIFSLLRNSTGVDFTVYKYGTLQRRILRRMALNKLENEEAYAKILRENRAELKTLFQDILISVTGFFREPATFEGLKRLVLPAIFKDRSPEDPVRVWIPGCSTGEEVYSFAIQFVEYMREAGSEVPVQIFGTDLSEAALERARAGIYPESIIADVSQERLRRFFVRTEGRYQISRAIRDLCVFAQQNLIRDPPFSKLDLISCRNVLIYLGASVQGKVLRLFHYGLKPKGFLVLGLSETVGATAELFHPLDKKLKIYSRVLVPAGVAELDVRGFDSYHVEPPPKPAPVPSPADLQKRVDQLILSKYAPAGVLVDQEMNILQFHGQTSPYLEHTAGEATLNLAWVIRPEFSVDFKKTFEKARKRNATCRSDIIRYKSGDHTANVRITVIPLALAGAQDGQYLVLFEEIPFAEPPQPAPSGEKKAIGAQKRVRDLEEELASTKQYLESVIEEQQATTEELKSANEEVQSSNEELQSTNEELLTAKEELQSTNEELTTLNEEMNSRNLELSQVNNDLSNLLASVNIPIVMLGNDLRVRRFTPQAEKVLNLLPTDIGRPVGDFKPKIDIPDLEHLFLDAIENLRVNEREVQDREGRWYSLWVRPYRTAENRIDGAVMVLVDVTERKQAAEARYRRLFEAARDGIILANAETGAILDLNPFMTKTFGVPRTGSIGRRYWELDIFSGSELDERSLLELQENETISRSTSVVASSGERYDIELIANMYQEGERRVAQFNLRDVTERKRLEERARRIADYAQQDQKMDALGRLAAGVAHDFNNLLTAILGFAELARSRMRADDPAFVDIEQVCKAADQAAVFTRQLLAFGRKQLIVPRVQDLNQVVRGVEPVIRATVDARADIAIQLGSDLKSVCVDRGQMEQVVLNLVMNALDATPNGGVITIETQNCTIDDAFASDHPAVRPGEFVCLTVSDTGVGLAEDARSHLFEPFFSTRPGKAKGLGLPMIYSTVKQSGGLIWAVSELGRGTTFRIYLPQCAAAPSETSEQRGIIVKGSGTVLVVDDDEIVRRLAVHILKRAGYKVLEAAGGPEALGIAAQNGADIDLLLTDVVMPHMNGKELADRLTSQKPGMKVVYMSGHLDDSITQHGVLERGVDLIHKPFTPELLARRIHAAMNSGSDRPEKEG
jgi:two-component system CheB/CheR fusion protein